MTFRDHAFLAPSSAHRWAKPDGCRASPMMQAAYPDDEEGEAAREGTAAHYYATEALEGRIHPLGTLAPNGYPINQEMIDCAEVFLRDIRDAIAAQDPSTEVHVEKALRTTALHELCWGTPDVIAINRTAKRLMVWDYKYGHRHVDAFENWQAIIYALLAVAVHDIDERDFRDWQVLISIVQPRNYHACGPVREWYTTGAYLLDRYKPQIVQAAQETQATSAIYTTGEHCLNCSGSTHCPALLRVSALSLDISLSSFPVDPTPHSIGLELSLIRSAEKRLAARKTGLEEMALAMLRSGKDIPFWRAEHSKGRERWAVTPEIAAATGDAFGVDLRKPTDVITPNQARKAGVPQEVVAAMSHVPSGALALVPFDDKEVSRAFGGN